MILPRKNGMLTQNVSIPSDFIANCRCPLPYLNSWSHANPEATPPHLLPDLLNKWSRAGIRLFSVQALLMTTLNIAMPEVFWVLMVTILSGVPGFEVHGVLKSMVHRGEWKCIFPFHIIPISRHRDLLSCGFLSIVMEWIPQQLFSSSLACPLICHWRQESHTLSF